MDRLQMHEKLRRAEGRVAALEKELLDNTRKWARDKAELQVRFSYFAEVMRCRLFKLFIIILFSVSSS